VIEQISEPTIFVGDGALLYRDLLVESLGPQALFAPPPPQSVIEQISEPTIFVGDGAQLYRDLLVDSLGSRALFAPSLMATPRAALGCLLAEARFTIEGSCPISQLTPCYLRLSEAEVARNARLAKTGTNF
jgi:hypothetical protein